MNRNFTTRYHGSRSITYVMHVVLYKSFTYLLKPNRIAVFIARQHTDARY